MSISTSVQIPNHFNSCLQGMGVQGRIIFCLNLHLHFCSNPKLTETISVPIYRGSRAWLSLWDCVKGLAAKLKGGPMQLLISRLKTV